MKWVGFILMPLGFICLLFNLVMGYYFFMEHRERHFHMEYCVGNWNLAVLCRQ